MVKVELVQLTKREAKVVREFCKKHGIEHEETRETLDNCGPSPYTNIILHLPDDAEVCESPWIPAIEDPKETPWFIKEELAEIKANLSKDEMRLLAATFFRLPDGSIFAVLDDDTLYVITPELLQEICRGYEDWEPLYEWQRWQEEFMSKMLEEK